MKMLLHLGPFTHEREASAGPMPVCFDLDFALPLPPEGQDVLHGTARLTFEWHGTTPDGVPHYRLEGEQWRTMLVALASPGAPAWRYPIGQAVQIAHRGPVYTITQRRWVERQIMPPYAEYALSREGEATRWEVEADVNALEEDHV